MFSNKKYLELYSAKKNVKVKLLLRPEIAAFKNYDRVKSGASGGHISGYSET